MKHSNSAERLKELMQIYNIKQADIVERTGIPKSAISMYLSGQRSPRQDRLSLIADAYNVSETWLMGYDVPMERESKYNICIPYSFTLKNKDTGAIDKPISNDILRIIASIEKLSPEKKKLVIQLIKSLSENTDRESEKAYLEPQAAHERTDIEVTDDMRKHDDDIMDDDEFWK